MTVDDESSIYVGGLPYDITDDILRRVFDIYGAVVAVKIINDRATGGKCYGFVTFSSPRAANQAIRDMDGKTIDGRVVKVNEVRTRGRTGFNNKALQRDFDDDGGRDRGRDANYDRHRHRDGHRERSLDHNREMERGHDRVNDRYLDEDRFRGHNRHQDDAEHGRERKRGRDWEREDDLHIEDQRNSGQHRSRDTDEHFLNRATYNDRGSREDSFESFGDDQDQIENKLAVSHQKLEELHEEISRMEDYTADKEDEVSQLQEKYQNLEDSLKAAKKLTSYRHMQLQKLHKCYLHLRDYDKRLKTTEEELQSLVDATSMELEIDKPLADAVLTNGRA